jgi:hypothetical protein
LLPKTWYENSRVRATHEASWLEMKLNCGHGGGGAKVTAQPIAILLLKTKQKASLCCWKPSETLVEHKVQIPAFQMAGGS